MKKLMKAFAPGRTEIAGNHVDHQHGKAVTGSLKQGIYSDVELTDDNIITIKSEGFEPFIVDINYVKENPGPNKADYFTSKALVTGVVNEFLKLGANVGGFKANVKSTIGSGMGLSSSAAFELLIGVILNEAYNNAQFNKMELAQIGYHAENDYYGKPCGLLDQTAISYGGIISIDFKNPEKLQVEPIDFSFSDNNMAAILVDAGIDHGDLSDLFASIPADMKIFARNCGQEFLNEINFEDICRNIYFSDAPVQEKPALRAVHYYHEITLVEQRIKAMKEGDAKLFMYLHGLSGSSSAQFLQNVTIGPKNQGASLCQAICEICLDIACDGDFSNRGASRIHGGGFGGCIQVFLPAQQADKFKKYVNDIYKKPAAQEIEFSKEGAFAEFV